MPENLGAVHTRSEIAKRSEQIPEKHYVRSISLQFVQGAGHAYVKAGFHLNECNDSAEAARVGACVVGSNVDSPAAALGRIG